MDLCNCPSGEVYEHCCGMFHSGKIPDTAEALMRSRYTAFARGHYEYLVRTKHPKKKSKSELQELKSGGDSIEWLSLEILNVSEGSKNDKTGKVKFRATYSLNGEKGEMVEHSRFRRFEGRWMYFDDKG